MSAILYFLLGLAIVLVTGACILAAPVFPVALSALPPELSASPEQMRLDVVYLADSCYPRNVFHPRQLTKAGDYIKHRFESMGYQVEEQVFQTEHHGPQRNLIVRIGPENGPLWVVGAHYDVCGEQPGADDNASAVAALLAIAEIFQKKASQKRIEMVAYTLEEPPYFRSDFMGSFVHAQSIKASGVALEGMVCLEMLGFYSDEPGSQEYPVSALKAIYPTTGNFIAVVGKMGQVGFVKHFKKKMKAGCSVPVVSINAPASLEGIDFSDHRNYWALGYKALMITNTAFFRNPNYHEPTDTPATLDYSRMAEVAKGVAWALM